MNNARIAAKKYRQRQGAAMIEFAIVAPLLFLFFFAAFEFCRAAMVRHTVDNAVYEAARVAIIPGATAAEARDTATRILSSIALNNATINIQPTVINRDTEDVTVTITVPYDQNSFVPHQFVGGDYVGQLTMVREGVDGNRVP